MSGIEDTCVLRARGLRKQYGREAGLVRAVDGVDLDVAAGQTLAVMGPSGCGKSTLLHLLGGLDRPTAGELFFGNRRVDQLSERALAPLRRHEIGFVFQAFPASRRAHRPRERRTAGPVGQIITTAGAPPGPPAP